MSAIQLGKNYTEKRNTDTSKSTRKGLLSRYMDFAIAQEKEKIYWYMKAIIIIPCVIMVPTIFLMRAATEDYVTFVGLAMALFFLNVMVHIAGAKSKIFVPVYHLSIALMILIPSISYLITQL